jgi:pyrroloquinoline-quinone synthase
MQVFLDKIINETLTNPNPYLSALSHKTMSKDDFIETQVQFFFAVKHFHHPMNTLANRIPENRNRALVLQNVEDELGNGDELRSHENTFLVFLNRLAGLRPERVRTRPVCDAINTFNTTLDDVCSQGDYRKAAALMAMIEWMFSGISRQIGQATLEMGWLENDQLVHYTTHQDLDVQHAKDFLDVIEPDWESQGSLIVEGMKEGAILFDTLYRNLYEFRGTRIREW